MAGKTEAAGKEATLRQARGEAAYRCRVKELSLHWEGERAPQRALSKGMRRSLVFGGGVWGPGGGLSQAGTHHKQGPGGLPERLKLSRPFFFPKSTLMRKRPGLPGLWLRRGIRMCQRPCELRPAVALRKGAGPGAHTPAHGSPKVSSLRS